MTKRKLFLIIVLFLTILTRFRFLWVWASPHATQPQLVKGVLDLRNKELNPDKLLTLKGQWEFYPNTLLPTFNKESLNKAPPKKYIQVPMLLVYYLTPYLLQRIRLRLKL
jgi:two-component system, sensor histidine kinase ChiS